jgi:acetoin utilization deacetylase AcuC-like enzyme
MNALVVLVSAGFDAADGDDLGECHVTPTGYAHMTHMLSGLAGGKLVVALEVCVSSWYVRALLNISDFRVATTSTRSPTQHCQSQRSFLVKRLQSCPQWLQGRSPQKLFGKSQWNRANTGRT